MEKVDEAYQKIKDARKILIDAREKAWRQNPEGPLFLELDRAVERIDWACLHLYNIKALLRRAR